MLETMRTLLLNQFEAALSTLSHCIDRCPDASWNGPVANYAFCQAAFHALFYADYYLGRGPASFRDQRFHLDNPRVFRDYEEFEDHAPRNLYDRESLRRYVRHCRDKAAQAIAVETAESLAGPSGFERLPFSRAELYVYNLRHVQHHAAQLILRLRLDVKLDVPWARSGWREA
jgi:hypothetical protein